jgi:hypothetical protein
MVRTDIPVHLGDENRPGLVADELGDLSVAQSTLPRLSDEVAPQPLRRDVRQLQILAGVSQAPAKTGIIPRL